MALERGRPREPDRSAPRAGHMARAGAAAARAPMLARAAITGEAPLLGCGVGPFRLAFDLRTLRHIDVDLDDVPLLPGAAELLRDSVIDLRDLFGTADGPSQALLYSLPGDPTLRRLIVDADSLRLLRVELRRILPVPPLLGRVRGLEAVRGLVEVEDGAALMFLLDPQRLATEAA